MKHIIRHSLLLVCYSLTSCSDSSPDYVSVSDSNSNNSPNSEQIIDKENDASSENFDQQTVDIVDDKAAQILFEEILKIRNGEKNEEAIAKFQNLLKKWNPIGRTLEDVKQIIGTPDREKTDSIRYTFDTGYQGYEWNFMIENNKVVSIKEVGID